MPDSCGDCGKLITCVICQACERHCAMGGSGACAATSWSESRARAAMDDLIAAGGRTACMVCRGLEADDDPHVDCRRSTMKSV